jgi:hypothetical protein
MRGAGASRAMRTGASGQVNQAEAPGRSRQHARPRPSTSCGQHKRPVSASLSRAHPSRPCWLAGAERARCHQSARMRSGYRPTLARRRPETVELYRKILVVVTAAVLAVGAGACSTAGWQQSAQPAASSQSPALAPSASDGCARHRAHGVEVRWAPPERFTTRRPSPSTALARSL